jgi:hypothetical protein
MYYENIGPLPGRVEIPADKKSQLVWYVSIRRNNLSLDDAKKLLGDDYRIIRYNFDSCLGDSEASPIYEDENGSLEFIVYASKGIVIHFQPRTNLVDEIDYESKPPGPKQSKCKGKPARN